MSSATEFIVQVACVGGEGAQLRRANGGATRGAVGGVGREQELQDSSQRSAI